MARSEAGRLLTEAHRRRQLEVRSASLRDVVGVWGAFSLANIDGSWGPVETGLLAILAARWRQSTGIAANYFRAFRTAEGVRTPAAPVLARPPAPALVVATLRLAGPIGAKKNIAAGVDPTDRTLTRVSGAVTRSVLNGGRQTLTASTRADREARGWRRVTDSDPCPWCRDLAGAVVSEASKDFEAHAHCGCTAEPAYS